jgi:hypothetical protein
LLVSLLVIIQKGKEFHYPLQGRCGRSGTIEQRIGEILTEKRALFADLVDDVAVAGLRHLDLSTLLRAVGVWRA